MAINCPSCGLENADDAKECRRCRAPFEAGGEDISAGLGTLCKRCEAYNEPGVPRCTTCGYKLSPDPAANDAEAGPLWPGEAAPGAIQQTQEFSALCPSSSAVMVKRLPAKTTFGNVGAPLAAGNTWLTILGLFLILPIACVMLVAVLYGLAWPDYPNEVFSWTTFDVAEFVPWILALALFSLTSIRPWLKAAVAVLSVPYSMLAFAAGELFVGSVLGNCL